jgi:Flp pilus assembly protein TadG
VGAGPVRVALRSGADDGASAVEFALILPVFLMMIFGMIGAGLVLDKKLSLSHSARESSRYGATYPAPSDPTARDAYLDQIASVAIASAAGNLDATIPGRSVCVAFLDGLTGAQRRSVDGVHSDGRCYDDARPAAETRIQVTVRRDTDWDMYLLPRWTLTIGSDAVSRYEVVSVPTPTTTTSGP